LEKKLMNNANIGLIVLLVALVLFSVYRRGRALLTRQKINPTALTVRLALFGILALLILVFSLGDPLSLGADLLGLLIGAAVAWYGLQLTQFEQQADGTYYTPNKYIGLAVFALFLLRFVYRLATSISTIETLRDQPPAGLSTNPLSQFTSDPLTSGVFMILAGYYACYYAFLLLRSRQNRAAV
jgi:hypothetical protein